jgi:CDP-diacylglycerol--glycerol-3-phosphate 3-phosphatidyltransferase
MVLQRENRQDILSAIGPATAFLISLMNLPNKLTVSRLWLTAIFVVCFVVQIPLRFSLALAVFLLATLTDYLDGVIARRCGLITDFGKLMDPLADKILTASAFIGLCGSGLIPAWAVIVIISREFLITGLRSLAASKAVVIPADKLGKHKTAWQMITIIYLLILLALGEWAVPDAILRAGQSASPILIAITVLLTVYSGLAYFWKNRAIIQTD